MCRAALTVFAGYAGAATVRYAWQVRAAGRGWRTAMGLGVLLGFAAAMSAVEGYVNAWIDISEPVPWASWAWLIGFDTLLPVWALLLLRAWGRRDVADRMLEAMAATDPLTGLLNRRGFARAAHPAITRARRQEQPVSVAMFDIDRFKPINDRFGHEAGDAVLRDIATSLRTELRAGDLLGRMGGEEFALVLPDTDPEQAAVVAERMCEAVRRLVRHPAGAPSAVTLSGGIAQVGRGGEAEIALERALREADGALYRAKEAGRNRVVREVPEPAL